MKINRQLVLQKIEVVQREIAQRKFDQQEAWQHEWDEWHKDQNAKSEKLQDALLALQQRVTSGECITDSDVREATEKFTFSTYRGHPRSLRDTKKPYPEINSYPDQRPEVKPFDDLLAEVKLTNRFAALKEVLDNAVDDNIAVSTLKDMGVLNNDDARVLFAAQVKKP